MPNKTKYVMTRKVLKIQFEPLHNTQSAVWEMGTQSNGKTRLEVISFPAQSF